MNGVDVGTFLPEVQVCVCAESSTDPVQAYLQSRTVMLDNCVTYLYVFTVKDMNLFLGGPNRAEMHNIVKLFV